LEEILNYLSAFYLKINFLTASQEWSSLAKSDATGDRLEIVGRSGGFLMAKNSISH
jgi:hypothetical protein